MRLNRRTVAAAAVFALSACWLYWLSARHFVLDGDEGIYLDGARRILAGQVPYRDFFAIVGPGTFWLDALALHVFGMTLAASRATVILDVSITAACAFWLVSRVNMVYGAWTAAVLVILETAGHPGIAVPNHRWDSATFATLALTICAAQPRRWAIFAAGGCAAFAGWITAPVTLVGVAIAIWLWIEDRARLWPFLGGCAAITAGCAAVLAFQAGLIPMIHEFLWAGSNNIAINHMFYGSVIGGYAQMFAGAQRFEPVLLGLIVLGFALPAVLPPLVALFSWSQRHNPVFRLLLLGGLALVVSTCPRMDLPHLTYVAPLFYVLAAILAASAPWPKTMAVAAAGCTLLAGLFAWNGVVQRRRETEVQTNVGTVRASQEDTAFIRRVQLEVPRGSRLFAFPYLPMAYFLTLDQNATRYPYLQPGVMNQEDESAAIAELSANPPERVLYFPFSESEILRRWPHTDRTRLHLRRVEAYLSSNYHRLSTNGYGTGSFEILEPNRPPIETSARR